MDGLLYGAKISIEGVYTHKLVRRVCLGSCEGSVVLGENLEGTVEFWEFGAVFPKWFRKWKRRKWSWNGLE